MFLNESGRMINRLLDKVRSPPTRRCPNDTGRLLSIGEQSKIASHTQGPERIRQAAQSPLASLVVAEHCGFSSNHNIHCLAMAPLLLQRINIANYLTCYDMSSRVCVSNLQATISVHRSDVLPLSLIHISEPTRLLSISYAVFCLKKKKTKHINNEYVISIQGEVT
eukprot:TRINITY_DN30500_c0_g1_i3.p1 TRINITY_DN30500_c0_g1~~TRINITY_DN30500_c0_g1_i3.p1  ORF type:complete len:166 (-),score=22.68 TRINITY_DN30500_c0_g1_i3:9-506(-)